jgi:hypothetical protein
VPRASLPSLGDAQLTCGYSETWFTTALMTCLPSIPGWVHSATRAPSGRHLVLDDLKLQADEEVIVDVVVRRVGGTSLRPLDR